MVADRGFDGEIEQDVKSNQKFNVRGKIEKIDDTTLQISELPINSWTNTYTDFLIGLMNTEKAGDLKIDSYTNHSSDTKVAFTVKLSAAMMEKVATLRAKYPAMDIQVRRHTQLHRTAM